VVWYYPQLWIDAVSNAADSRKERGNTASRIMARAAHVLKMVQTAAFVYWMMTYTPGTLTVQHYSSMMTGQPLRVALGLALMGVGQAFNVGIYKAIGTNGVYYGNRFGAELGPWVTGFPFNMPGVMGRHPQYFGVLCTMWGIVILIATEAAIGNGLVQMAGVWSCFYFITSAIEQTEDTNRDDKAK